MLTTKPSQLRASEPESSQLRSASGKYVEESCVLREVWFSWIRQVLERCEAEWFGGAVNMQGLLLPWPSGLSLRLSKQSKAAWLSWFNFFPLLRLDPDVLELFFFLVWKFQIVELENNSSDILSLLKGCVSVAVAHLV